MSVWVIGPTRRGGALAPTVSDGAGLIGRPFDQDLAHRHDRVVAIRTVFGVEGDQAHRASSTRLGLVGDDTAHPDEALPRQDRTGILPADRSHDHAGEVEAEPGDDGGLIAMVTGDDGVGRGGGRRREPAAAAAAAEVWTGSVTPAARTNSAIFPPSTTKETSSTTVPTSPIRHSPFGPTYSII